MTRQRRPAAGPRAAPAAHNAALPPTTHPTARVLVIPRQPARCPRLALSARPPRSSSMMSRGLPADRKAPRARAAPGRSRAPTTRDRCPRGAALHRPLAFHGARARARPSRRVGRAPPRAVLDGDTCAAKKKKKKVRSRRPACGALTGFPESRWQSATARVCARCVCVCVCWGGGEGRVCACAPARIPQHVCSALVCACERERGRARAHERAGALVRDCAHAGARAGARRWAAARVRRP